MVNLTTRITEGTKPKPANIPKYIIDGAARATLRAMTRYFDDPSVKADYEKWLEKQINKETERFQ